MTVAKIQKRRISMGRLIDGSSKYAGGEDVGGGRGYVCNTLAAVPVVRRLQLVRQSSLREPLVPALLSPDDLR